MRPETFKTIFKLLSNDYGRSLIRKYQDHLLRQTIEHASENSPFYRAKLNALGLEADDTRRKEDLSTLPFFTTAEDIIENPFQFLAVPQEKLQYMWTTSGTTGKPKTIFFTKGDMDILIRTAVHGLILHGVQESDVVQICFAYGQPSWMAGPFAQRSLEAMGCLIIPSGNHRSIEKQIETMILHRTTILFGTPSYLHRLTEEGMNICDLRSLSVRMLYLGGEPFPESLRETLEDAWDAEVYDSYGMVEMGNTVAGECEVHDGLHLILGVAVEVVGPQSGAVLEQGQEGELVYTTLFRKGMPLIRYRSGDISRLLPDETCDCGVIATPRMARVRSRADDMTFLGTGENVYPGQFDEALLPIENVVDYRLILDKQGFQDTMLVQVETDQPSEELRQQVVDSLYRALPFLKHDILNTQTIALPLVEFTQPGALVDRGAIKVKRLTDRRA